MAYLIKQSKTYYVDAAGKRVPKGTRGAKKVSEESAKWYGAGLPNQGKKRFPLATDKNVAAKKLADLVVKFERGEAQMPDRAEAGLPLAGLVTEFGEAVRRKSKEKHTLDVLGHVNKVLAGCRLSTVADLRASGAALKVESFVWSLTKGDDAISLTTAAYTGKHAKQFTRWLWRKKKLLDNDPLAGVDLPSQETGQPRRAFTLDELNAIINAAEASAKTFRGLAGPDRAILYLTAAATGLRAGELAQLTPANLDLDADIPTARLKAKQTKNRKPVEQPIPAPLAARLRVYIAGKPVEQPIWPGTWVKQKSAAMLRIDLAAANVPAMTHEGEGTFHSLRHTYTSMLARSAPVKVTQELLRHSSPALTIGRYAHSTLAEKAEAVAALPLPGSATERGPFTGMSRTDLEATAETLLVAVRAFSEMVTLLVTPRVTPKVEIPGDGRGLIGTMPRPKRRK